MVFLKASREDWQEGPLQLAIRIIEAGSRATYGSALRRFLDGRDGTKGLAEAIDDRLQQLACMPKGGSAARELLSVIRMLEKLHLLPTSEAGGIRRISAPNAAPQVFEETADLEHLRKSRDHWSWIRLFLLSLCAVVYRMRSGNSESVT